KLTVMKKIAALLILSAIVFSCKGTKTVSEEKVDYTIENIAKISSAEALEKKYPDGNIVNGKDFFEEGTIERAYSVLYQNTPNELMVVWQNDKVYTIMVSKKG